MKYIGKRIVARNGDTALMVNGKIVLTKEKLNDWLYYVDSIKEVDGIYIGEGLTPIETGVMNTTSLTFGNYKIYKRPFFVNEKNFVTNIENINKQYENKYFGGGNNPIAFIGVELEGFFPQFKNIDNIDKYAKDLAKKYNVLSVSATNDNSIMSGEYKTREIQYMIDRSNLGDLKGLYEELGIKQNKTCGNHIHMSFNSPEYYWLVFSPIFYERFKKEYEKHFKTEKYTSRLSNVFCEYKGINTVFSNTRYKMINNLSFLKYGTVEFRILPYTDNANEYYESVKFVVDTTEKILKDLLKEEYIQRILSDYAIPLVVIDSYKSGGLRSKAYDLLEYFYPEKDFSQYFPPYNNFALLYYPEKNDVIFFEIPYFSNLIVTKLTSENKPTQFYYEKINSLFDDLYNYNNK